MRVRIPGGAALLRGLRPKSLLHGLAQIIRKTGQQNQPEGGLPAGGPVAALEPTTTDTELYSITTTGTHEITVVPSDAMVSFGDVDVTYNAVSNPGLVRRRNEDACGLFVPPDTNVMGVMGILAVLADGMGGHESGDRASRLVLEAVGKSYYESNSGADPGDALVGAVEAAHRAVLADASANNLDMGSTCSALLLRDSVAYAAHVGDSRIYRWRARRLEQLTEDDSMVAEMVRRGILTPAQAHRHPDRSVLLNAVGQSADLTVSRAATPCDLQDGDLFLLCSDGLHGLVEDTEISGELASGGSLAAANRRLLEKALERGGGDNISIVLMRVHRHAGPVV